MLCQNCGKNEVNFKYTQIINGVKKEMALCDKCAKSLGLETLDFSMPIDFSSFLGDFFNIEETDLLPNFTQIQTLKCKNCGMTYQEFVDSGKFGCSHCYDVFANKLDPVLKNIHGSINHVGRRSRLINKEKKLDLENIKKENVKKETTQNKDIQKEDKIDNKNVKIEKLNEELKLAIKEERYEDAAKIRDEIKKFQ